MGYLSAQHCRCSLYMRTVLLSQNPCPALQHFASITCWVYSRTSWRTHTTWGCPYSASCSFAGQQTGASALQPGTTSKGNHRHLTAAAAAEHVAAKSNACMLASQPFRCLVGTAMPCSCTRGSCSSSKAVAVQVSSHFVLAGLCVAAAAHRSRTQPQPPLLSISSCAALTSHSCGTLQAGCRIRQPLSAHQQEQHILYFIAAWQSNSLSSFACLQGGACSSSTGQHPSGVIA